MCLFPLLSQRTRFWTLPVHEVAEGFLIAHLRAFTGVRLRALYRENDSPLRYREFPFSAFAWPVVYTRWLLIQGPVEFSVLVFSTNQEVRAPPHRRIPKPESAVFPTQSSAIFSSSLPPSSMKKI